MRSLLAASFGIVLLAVACAPQEGSVGSGDANLDEDRPAPAPAAPSTVPPTGSIPLTLTADKGAATDDVVSFGLPFPQGAFANENLITVRDKAGKAVPISTKLLAKWPADGSVRSVLVAFKATLAEGKTEAWKLEYGTAPAGDDAGDLAANPDGPISARLTAEHYSASHVSGVILPASKNERFKDYEAAMADGASQFAVDDYKVDCQSSSLHRSYYDSPHARYQIALRTGDAKLLRAARAEAVWYRANELEFHDGKKMAINVCESTWGGPDWTPDRALDWGTLRQMTSQGMLDDYLITGDPAAKQAVITMGEAFRQNLPALSSPDRPTLEITERNLGWTLLGMASYYALDNRTVVKDALDQLVDRTIAWQGRGRSGALEHDINRPDPDECEAGPKGASPFMTSVVVDGMMDYWLLTADNAKVGPFIKKLATWYEKDALTSDKGAFRYLWGCTTNPYDTNDPDGRTSPELNFMIVHVFGAAYALDGDRHWLDVGDKLVDTGFTAMFVTLPKQWNQAARTFGKYLGYRGMRANP